MMGFLYGGSAWTMVGLHLHMVFATALFVGLVFFFVYAIKFMKKDDMKKWLMWLLIVGLIGSLLTCGLGWKGMKQFRDDFGPRWGAQVQLPTPALVK